MFFIALRLVPVLVIPLPASVVICRLFSIIIRDFDAESRALQLFNDEIETCFLTPRRRLYDRQSDRACRRRAAAASHSTMLS